MSSILGDPIGGGGRKPTEYVEGQFKPLTWEQRKLWNKYVEKHGEDFDKAWSALAADDPTAAGIDKQGLYNALYSQSLLNFDKARSKYAVAKKAGSYNDDNVFYQPGKNYQMWMNEPQYQFMPKFLPLYETGQDGKRKYLGLLDEFGNPEFPSVATKDPFAGKLQSPSQVPLADLKPEDVVYENDNVFSYKDAQTGDTRYAPSYLIQKNPRFQSAMRDYEMRKMQSGPEAMREKLKKLIEEHRASRAGATQQDIARM